MRHRLENATDFFPLPVAQVALCPSSVSHFPFYGSPPSFLVEASLLPAVGSSWRGCGHARLIWHSKNMAATTPSFALDLRGDWFCIRSSKQFIVGDDFRPKEAENSLQCSLIPTNCDNYFIFRRSRRYCPCTHQPTSMKPEYLRLWFVQLWSAAITSQILCT